MRRASLLGELVKVYLFWLEKEVQAGRKAASTLYYYSLFLGRFAAQVGETRSVRSITGLDLELYKTGWHSVQAVQRLFNWAVEVGLLKSNPVGKVKKPALGNRQLVLTRAQLARLMWAAKRPLRRYILLARHTFARPGELRQLERKHWRMTFFELDKFKAKNRRRDAATAKRRIRLDSLMQRMVRRWLSGAAGGGAAKRPAGAAGEYVLLNTRGKPWTSNALRLAMKRAAKKAGLPAECVAYTLRHTGATWACENGVRDRILADLMDHTKTDTTRRYQHVRDERLEEAIEEATVKRDRAKEEGRGRSLAPGRLFAIVG